MKKIEVDPDFCSHGIERWENSTGKQAVKLNNTDKKEPETDSNKTNVRQKEPEVIQTEQKQTETGPKVNGAQRETQQIQQREGLNDEK
jgi:hypothetical protein